ncbi:unnamed protein product [Rotaria magnacalcarata]|uniref:Uncharacterized protein n=1 Tax=Rotaria magnacalcarata TaxID=392030 RepID=A0A8S2N7K5_9BILA|nr:unnamed protein product [Rotaria magnacalcarata]
MIDKLLFILICLIYPIVHSVKEGTRLFFSLVVLSDTREARDYLNWYKISTNGYLNDGWGELSFEAKLYPTLLLSSSSSTLWRTQYVCDITSERRVDNWLRTPYLRRQEAQRIEIELGFSIRDCSTFQTPNEIRSCRETFELYIHETDHEEYDFSLSSYKLVDIIAGNRFTSNNYGSQISSHANNLTVNVKTRGVSINKDGFYIAFRDQGACISLLYVKIFYRLCQDISVGLIHFPETPTGSHLTDIVERYGICTMNSKTIQQPIGFCKGNGEWTFQETSLHDSCNCQQGYEQLIDNNYKNNSLLSRAICKVCPIGTYKSTASNFDRCQLCPLNSHAYDKGSTLCICNDGFFRLNSSIYSTPCIGSPSQPENVTIDEIDQSSVRISWKQLNDHVYHIECIHFVPCESFIIYEPRRTFINESSVKISGLDDHTNYKIKLYAEQISTHLFSKSVDLSFTTKTPISQQIHDVRIQRITFDTIVITWLSDDFVQYQIRYWPLIDANKKMLITLSTNNFTLVTKSDSYKYQIRGYNKHGWTSYTQEKLISLNAISIDKFLTLGLAKTFVDNKYVIVIGPLFVLVLLIIVMILGFIYVKKTRLCQWKAASDCESLDYQKRQVIGHYGPDAFFNSGWTAPLWPSITTTTKTYIDPHTYEDPTKAVRDFARELDPNLIVIESVIGGVADFGLSRETDADDGYTTKGGKIPIRWTAIEAIDYRKFTSASDVWSFGVLCWEVVSFGERPYWNWSNQDVIKTIKNSFRLPPPMNCPDVIYRLMLACWNEHYLERPKFDDIVQMLIQYIQLPNLLVPLAKQRIAFVNHPDQPNIAQFTSTIEWLHNIQLDRLICFFINAGYTNLSQICHFNSSDLTILLGDNITLDEQNRLLDSLTRIRSDLVLISSKSLLNREGYLV